jgi:adenylate kinase family enzyme
MQQIILITGPAGAGKSAVAAALCERYDRMAHIEVDLLRHMIKAGYRHPWADDAQAEEQRALAVRNACAIARECVAARYAVVIDDVILAPTLAEYRAQLAGAGAHLHLVTLLPSLDVALARDRGRSASIPDRVRALHADFAREAAARPLPGAILDTSADANAALTADRVQDAVATAAALLQ